MELRYSAGLNSRTGLLRLGDRMKGMRRKGKVETRKKAQHPYGLTAGSDSF